MRDDVLQRRLLLREPPLLPCLRVVPFRQLVPVVPWDLVFQGVQRENLGILVCRVALVDPLVLEGLLVHLVQEVREDPWVRLVQGDPVGVEVVVVGAEVVGVDNTSYPFSHLVGVDLVWRVPQAMCQRLQTTRKV